MPSRYYSAIAQDTTLTASITNTSTSMVVGATVGYPSTTPFVLAVDYNAASEELVLVTGISGTTLNITRGFNGTTPVSHNTGAAVRHVAVAQDLTDAQTHYDTALSSGAHGVTGALATFLGTPNSANLSALVTDETGSGNLVFSTGPTLSGPTLSGPTITGTLTAGGTTGASGQMLTSSGSGISWTTPVSPNFTVNAQTATTYTAVLADVNKVVTLSNTSAITVTLPAGVYSVGATINFIQLNSGQVIFQGDGTSTVLYTPGLKTRAQNSVVSALVIATNTFLLVGDLTA